MSRLQACFKALADQGRTALIPFITAGFPKPQWTVPAMHQLVDSGADVIEIGVPFSDPMADGPVIQQSSESAIAQGVCLADVLQMVAEFRQRDRETPVVLMGYLNPQERYGHERFAADASQAGVDGVLLVDAPVEESTGILQQLRKYGLHQIFLVAPTTDAHRVRMIAQSASGFIYYVSLKGVTGSSLMNVQDLAGKLATIREVSQLPVAVGFGVNDAAGACAVARHADAVVIGSALIKVMRQAENKADLLTVIDSFLHPVRHSLDEMIAG